MICQQAGRTLSGKKSLAVLFLVGASVSTAFIAGIAPLPAYAKAERSPADRSSGRDGGGGDENNTGNGSRNKNISAVRSPTKNRGFQHTSTSDIGGATSVQNALCRDAKVCTITQNVTVVLPAEAGKGDPRPADTDAMRQSGTSAPEPDPTSDGVGVPDTLDTALFWYRDDLPDPVRASLGPGFGDLW